MLVVRARIEGGISRPAHTHLRLHLRSETTPGLAHSQRTVPGEPAESLSRVTRSETGPIGQTVR